MPRNMAVESKSGWLEIDQPISPRFAAAASCICHVKLAPYRSQAVLALSENQCHPSPDTTRHTCCRDAHEREQERSHRRSLHIIVPELFRVVPTG